MKIKRAFGILPLAAMFVGGTFLSPNKDNPYTSNIFENNAHTIDTTIAVKKDTILPVVSIPAVNPDLSSMIIAIEPGHDSTYIGSRVNGAIEEDLTLSIAKKIDSLLILKGYPTYMTRTNNTRMNINNVDVNKDGCVNMRDDIDTISKYIKSVDAKLAIIIHYGAYSAKKHFGPYREFNSVNGAEFYFYGILNKKQLTDGVANYNHPEDCKIYSASSMTVAKELTKFYNDNGMTARVWGSDFRILCDNPAEVTILTEFKYLTNKKDFEKATSKEGQLADAKLVVDFIDKKRDMIFNPKSYAANLEKKLK